MMLLGVVLEGRDTDMLWWRFVNVCPLRRALYLFWSLQKVLALLSSTTFWPQAELCELIKVLILMTLVYGLRSSQLHAVTN